MENNVDNQFIEGEIADYLLTDTGILVAYSKSILRTVENIKANVALVKEITHNKKVPLLIYLKNSPVPDKATRKFSTEQLPHIYTAMAMVSKPGLAQLIMKLLFTFQNPPIPMKSFTDDEKAKAWLMRFL
ncbi:SpoIIAA family protein [Pedobacter ghigonis]|uniref:STAS/SEC14 domain-containing protein n=1 Tax=Pedobacter ghigonis TaxID=2730403 RepID=UPI00158B959B|nr:STAS/SEC14 domain-containing protein [Pedobacter ghigonis]